MGCEGLHRARQWALMVAFGRLRALVLQQSPAPRNLSRHRSGSLGVMIKSCRETGLVAQCLQCLTQESLASSCEPLKLGSVDPQMGWGLGICILNTTTPVPQPPPTPVSLSGKLRSSWLCQPSGLPLDCFCP